MRLWLLEIRRRAEVTCMVSANKPQSRRCGCPSAAILQIASRDVVDNDKVLLLGCTEGGAEEIEDSSWQIKGAQ